MWYVCVCVHALSLSLSCDSASEGEHGGPALSLLHLSCFLSPLTASACACVFVERGRVEGRAALVVVDLSHLMITKITGGIHPWAPCLFPFPFGTFAYVWIEADLGMRFSFGSWMFIMYWLISSTCVCVTVSVCVFDEVIR